MDINIENRKQNRLIHEKSPYLLQHAQNPVDWFTWGEEAFEKANRENKPIFMSIGYATCHWCHVMERESFENEEVAELLNREYVCIKVDREERPDIDHIYMQVCQTLTGSGGWPLTIIMTPEQKPFYAATYLPPHGRGGLTGLVELLSQLAQLWKSDRATAVSAGQEVSDWIRKTPEPNPRVISDEVYTRAFRQYQGIFDSSYGGFGPAPKFPSPHTLFFLLKYYELNKDQKALEMVEKSLNSMYQGGIYDHIGFGFARYSTDRKWLVPHFEKMLYDNALLAIAYLEAYRITQKELYGRVAREILTYVLRDMTSPNGGFYCAEDADSEGKEGKFYTWTLEEVMSALGPEGGARFCETYDISKEGNFEGKNIPNLIHNPMGIELREKLESDRQALFALREKRVKPLKDDKILTGWNGLMIAAMAMGSRILNDKWYLEAAQRAADFIFQELRQKDGRLLARFRDGQALYSAYAMDYAFFIWGLIELHEAGADRLYLEAAKELNNDLLKLFWDTDKGGLFFYGEDCEELLVRPKESYDGALPSDNAVATLNFLRLARITGNADLQKKAQAQFWLFSNNITEFPTAHAFWLLAALNNDFSSGKILH